MNILLKKIFPVILFFIFLLSFGGIFSGDEDDISNENIECAEKIIGLNFTEAERDSMIEGLQEQLSFYEEIRKIKLDNSIPPAIQFNSVPVGFKFSEGKSKIETKDYSYTKMPENKDDLAFYSIGELAYLIKNKKTTSEELTVFFLERLKKYGHELESVITLTKDRALEQARKMDKELAEGKYRGLLHGIPFGVKDLLSTKNYKTTWGATPFKDQMINKEATVIKKLEDAGAVLVAKLTMGALAWGDVWFGGKTRNPWNINEGSSGSSAGSASSVSAGLVPFALGTETWGSIISPSTVCGVSGLRPTYGRVSRTGVMTLSWSMDKIGPICRNAEDCAIVFNTIKGPDGIDQTLYDLPFNYSSKIEFKNLKVGYLKSDFEKDYVFHNQDSISLKIITDMGIELIPVELPDISVDELSIILSVEAAAAFDELTRSNKDDLLVRQIKNAWPNEFRKARFIPAVEYINANRIRYKVIQKMYELMKEVDIYIAPSWEGKNLLLTNLTGNPCVVVPNGFSEEGTPTSITFNGKLFDEGIIIAFANKFQEVTDFHKKHPDLDEQVKKKNK